MMAIIPLIILLILFIIGFPIGFALMLCVIPYFAWAAVKAKIAIAGA